ncbi:MAG: transcription factor jumonji jmjc protein [Gammaproteobacteria bacterium]|nr:transcription factor jumonji jmjc protein [Gammaproteobacteria bacterium]
MTAPLARSSAGGTAEILNRLPGIPSVSIRTAGQLALAVEASKPLILKGLIEHWPALAAGRHSPSMLNNYLKSMDRGIPGPVMEAPASTHGRFGYSADLREFTFSTRQRGVSETLDRIERQLDRPSAPIIAMQMLPLATHLPDFVQQNPLSILPQIGPLLWLGGGVRTQIHNDRDHNLACVIAGRRRFVVFPPEQVPNLYIGPIDNPPPLSIVDLEAPDFARFPRFEKALATAQAAELGPGDALFMPRHWWHHVTSRDPYNAMVNYWWGTHAQGVENPYDCFLAAVLAIKDLPSPERSYWQAMFNAYIFQSEGSAVEHIPPELRGVLGTLRSGIRAALKQRLKASFLKSP